MRIRVGYVTIYDKPNEQGAEGHVWYEIEGELPNGSSTAMIQPFSRSGKDHPSLKIWKWDGDRENPTLTPSYLCRTGHDKSVVAHFFFTKGKIVPCSDQTLEVV